MNQLNVHTHTFFAAKKLDWYYKWILKNLNATKVFDNIENRNGFTETTASWQLFTSTSSGWHDTVPAHWASASHSQDSSLLFLHQQLR